MSPKSCLFKPNADLRFSSWRLCGKLDAHCRRIRLPRTCPSSSTLAASSREPRSSPGTSRDSPSRLAIARLPWASHGTRSRPLKLQCSGLEARRCLGSAECIRATYTRFLVASGWPVRGGGPSISAFRLRRGHALRPERLRGCSSFRA